MAGTLEEVKNALIKQFKNFFPTFDVFCEEIVRTEDDDPEAGLEDWIYLDIISASNITANEYHTDRSILIDASIHVKKESNAEYLQISQEVDGMIRPVFRFGARAITVQNIEFKTVDKVLHAIFTLSFRDTVDEPEQLPYMETLEDSVKTD